MIDFLTAGPNLPFSIALAVMLFMAVIEGVGFLIGLGVFDFLDSLVPDVDLSVDGSELAGMSLADKFMGWLHFGRVPVLILLVVFLTAFGLLGLSLQALAQATSGHLLPGALASAIAFPVALPMVRTFGGMLAKVLPKDETYVSSQEGLIGLVGEVVLGEARAGSPAQVKLRDKFGQVHYLMVEPDDAGVVFTAGDSVLIVSRAGATYRAIRNTHPSLTQR